MEYLHDSQQMKNIRHRTPYRENRGHRRWWSAPGVHPKTETEIMVTVLDKENSSHKRTGVSTLPVVLDAHSRRVIGWAGCPIFARSLRKGGIPRMSIPAVFPSRLELCVGEQPGAPGLAAVARPGRGPHPRRVSRNDEEKGQYP